MGGHGAGSGSRCTAIVQGGKGESDKGIAVDLLLNSQRRRANAQADFYRAVVEYNKSIANVQFRKGSLLEYNNVQLAEGPWPKKAYWDALGNGANATRVATWITG